MTSFMPSRSGREENGLEARSARRRVTVAEAQDEPAIVDAEAAGAKGNLAFRHVVEMTNGSFEFQKSPQEFPVVLQAISNTNLLLDTLQHLDEAKA